MTTRAPLARPLADLAARAVFLPIVARELRVSSRRWKTYYGRMFAAAIWITAAAIGLAMASGMRLKNIDGRMLFAAVSVALFGWAALSSYAGSDSISVEKRDGTIGFLFLTDLKSFDIVLGKMVAAALPPFYAILAALPLLAICMLMGGVAPAQYAKAGLAILNVFFLGQALGMFASALCRVRGNAMGLPSLMLTLYLGGLGMAYALSQEEGWAACGFFCLLNNPARPLYLTLHNAPALGEAPGYWPSLLTVHLQAWMFLALAVWLLPRRWRENPKKAGFWKRTWERWRLGDMGARAEQRRKWFAVNPFVWLVSRGRFSPASAWSTMGIVIGGMVIFIVWLIAINGSWGDSWEPLFVFVIILLQTIFRLMVPSHASVLEEHRRNGSLEIILCCSPLSVEEILQGMWLMLRRYYYWPTVVVIALHGVMFIATLGFAFRRHDRIEGDLLAALFVSAFVLVFDLRAKAWMAMWIAMSHPKPRSGGATALFWISIFPWLLVGACYGVGIVRDEHLVWILWPCIALTNDACISRLAHERLREHFRLWANPSHVEPRGFWPRLGRLLAVKKVV